MVAAFKTFFLGAPQQNTKSSKAHFQSRVRIVTSICNLNGFFIPAETSFQNTTKQFNFIRLLLAKLVVFNVCFSARKTRFRFPSDTNYRFSAVFSVSKLLSRAIDSPKSCSINKLPVESCDG